MSVIIECFLQCDKCGNTFGVDNRQYTKEKHRQMAKAEGWVRVGDSDYCAVCVENIKTKKNP